MRAVSDVLGTYQHVLSELVLRPGDRGIFDVEVDGELIFSKHAVGRHAEPGEILELLRDRVGPDVRPYGT